MIKYLLLLLPFFAQAKEIAFYGFGLSYHGYGMNSKEIAGKVPHKLDSMGKATYHPEISILYSDEYLYGVTYLKNTFNNDAFMFSFGKSHQVAKYTQTGIMASLYINEREPGVAEPNIVQNSKYNLMFFPWVFLKQDIKITSKINFSMFLTSNFFLSHLAFGTSVQL